ncbi:sensory/regulatory protein RpfC [Duganella sp. HH101]|nr:sensory/regulatory protein RpfC [Duganella sp. HH101]
MLVVDDSAAVRDALQAACGHLGWVAVAAADAVTAVALLQDSRRLERPYDLLLLDRDMPDMDGAAMLGYIQSDLALPLPPVLMMVAEHAAAAQALLSGRLGVAGVLSKPVSPARLRERVAALASGAGGDAGMAPHHPHTPLHGRLDGMRILLVEDNKINQEVAQYILLHAGAKVDTVANGQLAVDLLRADPLRCDVVLMDVQMPVLNGYDATRAIRALGGALARLPIVAMTANVMDDDRRRAGEAGMDAHVAKPIDVEEMLGVLTRLAGSGARAAAPQAGAAAAATAGLPDLAALPSLPGIDLDAALARLGGNREALLALLKRFEQSQGGTVTEVRALLADGQRQQAAQSLHRLRGVAANLGAGEVASLTAAAEAVLRQDPDMAQLQAALDPLERRCSAWRPAPASCRPRPRRRPRIFPLATMSRTTCRKSWRSYKVCFRITT